MVKIGKINQLRIVKEVDLVLNSIFDGWKNLDANKAFKNSFSNSLEFNYIGIDGAIMSYNKFFSTAEEVFSLYKKAEFNINEKKIQVVSKDIAEILVERV